MRVLGLESAGTVASVALVENGVILCDFTINGKYTHSRTIMPMLEAIKTIGDIDLSTIDGIGVSGGPGSYTGLRIGSSTAKGLAQVWEVPIVPISTIDSLAHNIDRTDAVICPMLDARRQHAFCGAYRYEGNELLNILPIDLRSVAEFAEQLKAVGGEFLFLGDGVGSHRNLIETYMDGQQWSEARASESLPRASVLALLAEQQLIAGNLETHMTHQPNYFRPSQAERELGQL